METKLIESLFEKIIAFIKTSIELAKLRALDKTSDFVSSLIPIAVVFFFGLVFLLFVNLGLAIWIGAVLGKLYFGFFAVAAFYLLAGLCVHFFLRKGIKRRICNAIIKMALK